MSIAEMGLSGTVFLQRATLADVDFGRASFDHLAPSECTFVDCDFRQATLDRRLQPLFKAKRRNTFRGCRFDGVDLRGVDPGGSRFERCVFDAARLDGWTSQTAEFIDCHFSGRLVRVRFYGRPWGHGAQTLEPLRSVNEFRGNDFRQADMVDVAFLMGIDVSKQLWPSSDDYVRLDRLHQRLTRGRVEILRWKDLDARGQALEMVQAMSFTYMQQNDLITRRIHPEAPTSPEVQRRVWETLSAVL